MGLDERHNFPSFRVRSLLEYRLVTTNLYWESRDRGVMTKHYVKSCDNGIYAML